MFLLLGILLLAKSAHQFKKAKSIGIMNSTVRMIYITIWLWGIGTLLFIYFSVFAEVRDILNRVHPAKTGRIERGRILQIIDHIKVRVCGGHHQCVPGADESDLRVL